MVMVARGWVWLTSDRNKKTSEYRATARHMRCREGEIERAGDMQIDIEVYGVTGKAMSAADGERYTDNEIETR